MIITKSCDPLSLIIITEEKFSSIESIIAALYRSHVCVLLNCFFCFPFGANLLVVFVLRFLRHRAEDWVVPANARSVLLVRGFRVANLVKLRLRDKGILL